MQRDVHEMTESMARIISESLKKRFEDINRNEGRERERERDVEIYSRKGKTRMMRRGLEKKE